ncbi:GNAT family N-acetyltransferase [Prevotella sp. 10(H)]|uniref:GNAT family N-acetyltransferase n=1 Tax=Prevotella sp. 10(H) TaxID=1158294 RepID=UPI0004A71DB0|nr:GNAT family N-acetyltransferase [Prevotella sp. 10(H)]
MIKKVTLNDDFSIYTKLLNDSFLTVATEFDLTKENSPTNNAFITEEQLRFQLTEKERQFFYFEENNTIIGFIAIEKSSRNGQLFYIEKVAVHPEFRKKGIGKQLMDFATHKITDLGGEEISIGLIDSNTKLKNWYKEQGFMEVEVKSYEHLPFRVCMMNKYLE